MVKKKEEMLLELTDFYFGASAGTKLTSLNLRNFAKEAIVFAVVISCFMHAQQKNGIENEQCNLKQ